MKGVEAMGNSLVFVPNRKMPIFKKSNKTKVYVRETRSRDNVPKSLKHIDRFFKEQNSLLKGIVKACRTIPEPLEEEVEDQEDEEQQEVEVEEIEIEIEEIEDSSEDMENSDEMEDSTDIEDI